MSGETEWLGEAPAKVNLRLEVLAQEASGYHQIETVFQALALGDRIRLTLRKDAEGELDLRIAPSEVLGPTEENLAVRAAKAFRSALEAMGSPCPGVGIVLEKAVPHGAGLGGGSSDAAAVLRGLNHLLGRPFTLDELMKLGARLGSDVPFFVSGAPRALGTGRGDRIMPVASLPVREVLLVVPPEPIATQWAYGVLAAQRENWTRARALGGSQDSAVPEGWSDIEAKARNDFEEALFPLRPDLARVKAALETAGGRPALLSGSGSAVFGIFETCDAVAIAEAEVRATVEGVRTIKTRTVG